MPDEPLWAERWGLDRRADGDVAYGDFVAAALAAGRTGNGVFGAKLMWGTLDRVVAGLATVHPALAGADDALLRRAFGRTAFIHLRREDVLAQAVSWLRAEQTDLWYVGCPDANGQEPRYDAAGIDELLRTIDAHNAAWHEWFAVYGVEPHRVRYEELAADPVTVTRGLLDFLGALLLTPLVTLVPSEAAGPALVVVGALMIRQVREIDFSDVGVAVPAFLTMTLMPFTYSITNGIGAGFVSWVAIRVAQGKARQIHPLMWAVAVAFVLYFGINLVKAVTGIS